MEALKPKTIIIYEGKDVSGDFAPIIKELTYRDYLNGKASEVSMTLSNRGGYFFGDWYPGIEDRINVMIGYEGAELLDTGTFWVDETDLSGGSNGEEFVLRAMSLPASGMNSAVHKINYTDTPIADIAAKVAQTIGRKVVGELSGTFTGIQTETDLSFLERVARKNGRILKVNGDEIVLFPIAKLGDKTILVLKKSDVIRYRITDIATGRLSKVTVKWWDKKTKKLIEGEYDTKTKGGGSVVFWQQISSKQDAQTRAKDIITERNDGKLSIEIETIGDTRLRAGSAIDIEGFGRFDGAYYIAEAKHKVNNQGYTTTITLHKND